MPENAKSPSEIVREAEPFIRNRVLLGYTLQPISFALFESLDRLNLPLLAMVTDSAKIAHETNSPLSGILGPKLRSLTEDQLLVTIWCFVTPIDQVEHQNIYQAIDCARNSIGAKLQPGQLLEMFGFILEAFWLSLIEVADRLQPDDFSI
jgi:hypothetical protein